MAIKYFSSSRDGGLRPLQLRMSEVGRIRLGRFNPTGKGRPERIDAFRFTSREEGLIQAVAARYGGQCQPWTPQGGGQPGFEVFTDVTMLLVYVPQQIIDPWNEAWAPGTCVRRCDGEWENVKQVPCPCNAGEISERDLCKPTLRVKLMLPEVPGIGTWRLETHGENATAEIATLAPLVAGLPMPVPAYLGLRQESRRTWNATKNQFDTNRFVVPYIHISCVSADQLAIGGDALTRALTAAGAPALLSSEPRTAIEATPAAAELGDEERGRILTAIRDADPQKLTAIGEALKARGVRDTEVEQAYAYRLQGFTMAAQVGGSAPGPYDVSPEALDSATRANPQPLVVAAELDTSIPPAAGPAPSWTDPGDPDHAQWLEACYQGATEAQIIEAGGPLHWLAGHDQALSTRAMEMGATPEALEQAGGAAAWLAEREKVRAYLRAHPEWRPRTAMGTAMVADLLQMAGGALREPEQSQPRETRSVDDLYTAIHTAAGPLDMTTIQVNDMIKAQAGVAKVQDATAEQLAAVLEGLRAAAVR